MQSERYPILYVDDERENLVTFRYAVEGSFPVLTAASGKEALELLESHQVAVLLSDQRMPEMTGVELCEAARRLRPDMVRIIITAYADLEVAIEAINRGQVARYLTKPWRDEELLEVLGASIELARLQQTIRDMQYRLLRQGEPKAVAALRQEVAQVLQVPVDALQINSEQVRDLLDAGLHRGLEPERAQAVLARALEAHREMDIPLSALREMTSRLSRRERLDAAKAPPAADVARVVRVVLDILRDGLGAQLEVRAVLHGTPIALVEPADLAQVITELVSNACRAVGEARGVVTIEVGERDGQVELVVEDTGPGVDVADRERIFDAFVSGEVGRRGHGLAIVRRVVQAVGGAVEVTDGATRGARFVVTLPALGGR